MTTSTQNSENSENISNIPKDFTLLYNPNWGYHRCSTKAYFQSIPDPTNFQHGYYGIENSIIKGSFHLRYPSDSPLHANKIELDFEGKQFISWKETNDSKNENDYVLEEKILYKQTKIIWESVNNQYEEIFTLDLPFEFPLPDNLPATITSLNVKGFEGKISGGVAGNGSELGYVTYNLRAQISRPINIFKLQVNQKKIIDAWCKIHRWELPSVLEKAFIKGYQKPFKWVGNFEGISYEVELEKILFDYKDTINIPMKFFNNNIDQLKIRKIYVKLKEYHKLKANGKSKKISGFVMANSVSGGQVRKLMSEKEDDNEYNEYCFIKMQLNLTRANLGRKLNCSTSTEMIDIWHKLKVQIYLENIDSSPQKINLEKEIAILNIVSKSDSPRLQGRLMDTWFYHHDESSSESVGKFKARQRFSWFGEMKDEDKHKDTTVTRKKRLSLFGGRNTR